MNTKNFYFLMLTGLVLFSGCKNTDDASSKIDANAQEIAPASPDAAAPVEQPTTPTTSPETTTTATANMPASSAKTTEMVFNKKEHDFGTITQGDKVNYTYTFKNTGTNDLIIASATGSCGCTVPEYPKEPIKPGKSGKMKVSFDSTGKTGQQSKTVTVRANTPTGVETLTIKANIKGGAATVSSTTTTVTPMPSPTGEAPKN
jgi:Protein of unknown function (DUF1573)